MKVGTLARTASHMVARSHGSRPATGGNKNVRATRKAEGDQMGSVRGVANRVFAGPDKGMG